MIDARRTQINEMINRLRNFAEIFKQLKVEIATVAIEERTSYEVMVRDLTASEQVVRSGEAANWLEEAFMMLEDFDLGGILDRLEDAKGTHYGNR